MKFKKPPKELNGKAPLWFRLWHAEHFSAVDARSKRNERGVYIILAAILGTSFFGKEYAPEIAAIIRALFGG